MAGPFDTYDIKFSEYTPQIDASLYTNALMHKRGEFDKGFERIQQSVDRLGTLPVIGEENKKAFQGKLDELTGKINDLGLDFSDNKSFTTVKSLSNTFARDKTVTDILSASSSVKKALELSEESIKKDGATTNDAFLNREISKWSKSKAGTPFNITYKKYRDINKEALDAIGKFVETETRVEPDGTLMYFKEDQWKKVPENIIDAVLDNQMRFNDGFAQQMSINSTMKYQNYSADELAKMFDFYAKKEDEEYEKNLALNDARFASASAEDKKKYEEWKSQAESNNKIRLENNKKTKARLYSLDEQEIETGKRSLYDTEWRRSFKEVYAPRHIAEKYTLNPLLSKIAKQEGKTGENRGNSTTLNEEGKEVPVLLGETIEPITTNLSEEVDNRAESLEANTEQSLYAILFTSLGDKSFDYFKDTPNALDANGMLLPKKLVPKNPAIVANMLSELYQQVEAGTASKEVTQAINESLNAQKEIAALSQAKSRVERKWNEKVNSDPELKRNAEFLKKLEKDYKNASIEISGKVFTAKDILNYKEAQGYIRNNGGTFISEKTREEAYRKSGIGKEDFNILSGYEIKYNTYTDLQNNLFFSIVKGFHGSSGVASSIKERDDFYNTEYASVLADAQTNRAVINTTTPKLYKGIKDAVISQLQIYNETGSKEYDADLASALTGEGTEGKATFTYSQKNGVPVIRASYGTTDGMKTSEIKIPKSSAESLQLYQEIPEYKQLERILQAKSTFPSVSTTGSTERDAMYFTTLDDNTTIKYNVNQTPNGYKLIVYKTSKGEDNKMNTITEEIPVIFTSLASLYESLKQNVGALNAPAVPSIISNLDL